jgi:hypothetical protein
VVNQQLDCILMVLRLMIMGISECLFWRTQQQVVLPLDEARVEIEKQLLADYFKGS